MKLATFGFLVSTIIMVSWWLGRTDNIIGWSAFVICLICVAVQIVSVVNERR